MSGDGEPVKILLPYLQRADEIQKHEPLIAYYCRLYVMDRGLKIPSKERTKTTTVILESLMKQLEKDKKSVQLSSEDNLYVEGFAMNVFMKADKQDRSGRADLNTAKTFYAASLFIEILHNFGEVQPDLEQKQKYAAWKAAEIRKALSEGKKPVTGPPGDDEGSPISHGGLSTSEFSSEKTATREPESSKPGFRIQARQEKSLFSTVQPPHNLREEAEQPPHNFPSTSEQLTGPSPFSHSSPYPSSYHASSFVSDTPVSPSVTTHQHGSRGKSYQINYSQYTQTLPDRSAGSIIPARIDFAQQGGSDAINYYQSPGDHSQQLDHDVLSSSDLLDLTISAPASVKGEIYKPPAARVAEAHKVSRFAVSALAFDDVPTAVSYLKQALELLTNP